MYKPEVECFDEPLTIRQTEENISSSGRSYTGFLKSLFTGSGTASSTGINTTGSTGVAPSLSSMVPTDRISELDIKGGKGNSMSKNKSMNRRVVSIGLKELSGVVYSAERGKLETVLLKPGGGANPSGAGGKGTFIESSLIQSTIDFVEESPPKTPKITSLSSSTLASMGGPTAGGKLKPSYYGKKGKHKEEVAVRSPTLT